MTRPPSFALADKMADPTSPRTVSALSTLFSRQREDVRAIVEKDVALQAKTETLVRLSGEVERLPEFGDVEAANAELKRLKEVAIDTPEIHAAKAKVKAARKVLAKVAVVREARKVGLEVKTLTAAQLEARRAAVSNLFRMHPKVLETTVARPLPGGAP